MTTIDQLEKHRENMAAKDLINHGFRFGAEFVGIVCPCCHAFSRVDRRRLNTAYVDDERNYLESCRDCFEAEVEHYADLWADYYSDCM